LDKKQYKTMFNQSRGGWLNGKNNDYLNDY